MTRYAFMACAAFAAWVCGLWSSEVLRDAIQRRRFNVAAFGHAAVCAALTGFVFLLASVSGEGE